MMPDGVFPVSLVDHYHGIRSRSVTYTNNATGKTYYLHDLARCLAIRRKMEKKVLHD